MKSKKPELSAALVAIKGAATPAADMPPRGSATEAGQGREELVPLNFRLPVSFRREFKTYAAQHDMKLNELLRHCFEAYRRQEGD
jgi:hypothetical protein